MGFSQQIVANNDSAGTRPSMSSKRHIKRKECFGKIAHPDREAAVEAAISLDRAHATYKNMHAYKCRFCKKWHVGHNGRVF